MRMGLFNTMSLRRQQYNALKETRQFLRDILFWTGRMSHKEMKTRARDCLKHFPFLYDNGQPKWSQDNLTEDREAWWSGMKVDVSTNAESDE